MEKLVFFLFAIFFLSSCNKEYYPNENDLHDSRLCGTWAYINRNNLVVFTPEGYYGTPYAYSNTYSGLYGIWRSEINDTMLHPDLFFIKNRQKYGMFHYTYNYYFSEAVDTLFMRKLNNIENDTLVRYKYQLIYNGYKFVGVDTIQ